MSSYSVLKHQHSSLQFTDNAREKEHDVAKIFEKGDKFPIKTGTESGDHPLVEMIEHYAKKHNHILQNVEGNWVAIDRDVIKPRSFHRSEIFVAGSEHLYGPQRDRAFPTIQFRHVDERMGVFGVAGFHYSTHGKLPIDPNWDTNRIYARKIAAWMDHAARGTNIAIGAGDFNMVDSMKHQDWAFGENFTSMADELGRHQPTTFDRVPIDGFVSYDEDGRIKAKKLEVLDDSEFQLFADHFLVRGTWNIRHLKL